MIDFIKVLPYEDLNTLSGRNNQSEFRDRSERTQELELMDNDLTKEDNDQSKIKQGGFLSKYTDKVNKNGHSRQKSYIQDVI